MRTAIALSCVLLAAQAAVAVPTLVYEQPLGVGAFGGFVSTANAESNQAITADNFNLTQTSSIIRVDWIGNAIRRGGDLGTTADYRNPMDDYTSFTVQFYSTTGGVNSRPDAVLFTETFPIGATNQTAVDPRNFSHSVNLTSPFQALSGVEYWLSVHGNVANPLDTTTDIYLWGFGTTGDARQRTDLVNTVTPWDFQNPVNHGFRLFAGIPEPGTAALAMLTFAGLLPRRRKA